MNILPQLQEHIKTELSLKTFLHYLIKNKIYDKELFTTNIRDSASNNLLLVAGAHKLWKELEQLVPFLDKSVFNYQNKHGKTLGQVCMEQSLAWPLANKLWTINPQSFKVKPTEYAPNFNGIKDPIIKDLNLNMCIEHIDKLYYIGVDLFESLVQEKGFEVFSGVASDAVTYRIFYTYLGYRNKRNLDTNDKEFYKLIGKIVNSSKEGALKGDNFIQRLLTNVNSHTLNMFLNMCEENPLIIQKMGINYLDAKGNSCLHIFVAGCSKVLSKLEKDMLYLLLDNCHHYNTLNIDKKDIYNLAVEGGKKEVADILRAYIEKKLMSNGIGAAGIKQSKKVNKI